MPNEINPSDPIIDETLESNTSPVDVSAGGIRRRLVLGFGATALGPVVSLLLQIVNVPVFLHFWGPELYGEWLVLSAIPTYLAMSDLGFGTVAANDMTMRVARNDHHGAIEVFQSTWRMITAVSVALLTLVTPAILLLPVAEWFHLKQLSVMDSRYILLLLAVDSLACLQTTLTMAGFKANGMYHYVPLSLNAIRIVEGGAILLAACLHHGPLYVAIVLVTLRALGNLFFALLAMRSVPWLKWGFRYASWNKVRELFIPAISFLAFPMATSFTLQATVIAIGVVLGSVAVSTFTPMRTMTRAALQVSETLKLSAWPELSTAYGVKDMPLARKLHRLICQLSLVLSTAMAIVLAVLGPWLFRLWTHGRINIDLPTFYFLIIDVIVAALWNTSSALPVAANKHGQIAVRQMIVSALSVVAAVLLMHPMRLAGSGAGLLLGDIVMVFIVLPVSLRLVQDHLGSFIRGMFDMRALFEKLLRQYSFSKN